MTRFWDGRTDGQTDGRSDCTPRPAFAFGDAGKKNKYILQSIMTVISIKTIVTFFNPSGSRWFEIVEELY